MMKKIVSLFLTLILVLSLPVICALNASAEDITKVVLDGNTYDVPVGETFVFETKISVPECSLAGGRVIVTFDKDFIEVVLNEDGQIYESDLSDIMAVGDYLSDGTGCSFAFAGTKYSPSAVLSGDKNVLVRFLLKAKKAGTAEIKFDKDSYDLNVFTTEDSNSPTAVVSSGENTGSVSGYEFVGNFITVREIENYQEYPEGGISQLPDENGTDENGESITPSDSDNASSPDSQTNQDSPQPGSSFSILFIVIIIIVIAAIAIAVTVIVRKGRE